jgi:osmoprotectant transport system substrate-binding protein
VAVRRPRIGLVAVLLLLAVVSGCTGDPSVSPSPATGGATAALRFASFDFGESQSLVEVYAEAARRAGLPVDVQHGVGTREIVSPAMEQGLVDVVIDYMGTALAFARPTEPTGRRTPEQVHSALERTLFTRGITVLAAADAADQNGFAVTRAFAGEHDLTALSDLAPLAGGLRFGGPPECPERPFCLLGLQQMYGMDFGEVLSMPSRAATADALRAGQIDVGMLETTNPRLAVSGLILLDDDRGLQPHENIVPLVRTDAIERWGSRLRTALDEVSARLTTEDLVQLNRAVEVEGLSPTEAAARWWSAA